MLTNRDIIVFSDDWGRHPFSCQHIMGQFLPGNRLIWVNTIGMRRPRLTPHDLGRSIQKLRSFMAPPAEGGEKLPANLTILNPFMLPFGNRAVRALNRRSVIAAVRGKMAELGFREPLLLTTLPNAADYLGAFGERLAVYYCVDDFTRWPGVNERLVREMEGKLLRGVDLLICSSPELADLKRVPGLATEILPHGVDAEHFARAGVTPPPPVPYGDTLRRPVIGYFGLLGEWVDRELLELIARTWPGGTLLLVGTVVADLTRIRALGNVVCPGPVPYADLPEHIAAMDLLILPYLTGGRGQSITPLKLREYIATGKPVVTTDIPECRLYGSVIHVAGTVEEFLEGVRAALSEGDRRGAERKRAVAGETWRDRAETMSGFLTRELARKGRG